MPYSLSQAAEAVGMNRSSILRAIKAGKISATRDEHDQWQIEPAAITLPEPQGGPHGSRPSTSPQIRNLQKGGFFRFGRAGHEKN